MRIRRSPRQRPPVAGLLGAIGVAAALAASSCGGGGGGFTAPVLPTQPTTPQNPVYRCGSIQAVRFLIERHGVVQLTGSVGGAGTVSDSLRTSAFTHGMHLEFITADSTYYAVADTCPDNDLEIVVADTTIVNVQRDPGLHWSFNLVGNAAGTTTITLHPRNAGHDELTLPPIPVRVLP